jgi:hypothetical protein
MFLSQIGQEDVLPVLLGTPGVTSSYVNKYLYFVHANMLSKQKIVNSLTFPQRSHTLSFKLDG